MTLKEPGLDLPSLGGSPGEVGEAVAHSGDKDIGQKIQGIFTGMSSLGGQANILAPRPEPTQQPIGSSACTPEAKQ